MLRFIDGNIFRQNAEALVNPVNCMGLSGKGLALEFKKRYPANYELYKKHCKSKKSCLDMGGIYVTRQKGLYIVNLPTKCHWTEASDIDGIDESLVRLKGFIKDFKISSVAIPALGCGLGGLAWYDVEASIKEVFSGVRGVLVTVLLPHDY